MKKLLALILSMVMVFSFAACGGDGDVDPTGAETGAFKVGVILIGDENEGYTFAHISGIQTAAEALGISADQIIWKYSVPEDESCADAANELINDGCTLVISNSYGHQSYIQKAASRNPGVQFISMTGDTAAMSGLDNFSNAFTSVYESRYVSGVVAGMKIKELVEAGALSDANFDENGNVKMGYVGAYPFAEVVSGYTAFYLGAKSVYENVSMSVQYTNSWFDLIGEKEAAKALVASGCVVIGQHADSTGAPTAVQEESNNGTLCYSVGYNIDMLSVAPTVALTSATNNWAVYYTYALDAAMKGEKVEEWSEGYQTGAVAITDLGPACAEGTAEKVAEVEEALKNGELHVFDTATFTVNGEEVTTHSVTDFATGDVMFEEVVFDGYFHESEFRSAPYFELRIDGITELN